MKKKIVAISAVLLFVISSVAIGGEWVYRENGTMMDSLAPLVTDARQRDTGALAGGIQSLNQGMESWLDSMKEKQQKEGMQAIAKMLQHDDISMAELF